MFFALGVLVAGLLGLMILPALWRRAVRLSTRRLEMQVPLSWDEVLAERDLLRAEFAVAERRLEDRLAQEQDARTRERAELGRKLAELARRDETLAGVRAELAQSEADLAAVRAALVDAQAQLGAALVEVYDGAAARERNDALAADAQRLKHVADERRIAAAALEARVAALEGEARDLRREIAERDKLVTARQTVLDRVTEERDRARAEVAQYGQQQLAMRSQVEARERRVSELDQALADMSRKLAAAERRRSAAPGGEPAEDDAGLRRSIEDLGAEVLRIARALETDHSGATLPEGKPKKRAGKGARAAVD